MPVIFAFALFVIFFVMMGVRVVKPFQKGVVERLGKYRRTAHPGITLLIPIFDKMHKIDMREQVVDVPPQEVITKDNVVVTVDAVVYYEATDPVKLVYNVADFYMAATKLAQTNLRNVVGDMELDQALTSRDAINTKLREVLDDATDKWGTRVVRVEIQRIDPPGDVTQAMHRQMKAERDKRAQVLEADGEKQAKVLRAEGEAEAIRKVAEANRFKLLTEAQGEGEAITTVFSAIRKAEPDDKLIAIRYLDALKVIADGKANKLFLPYEASGILGALGGVREIFKDQDEGMPTPPVPENKGQRQKKSRESYNFEGES
ncbi:MAG TPA: SPFH domain-containing protein [Thermoanaerobaculia bacterium]|nr:SPFH domain-containing protein [Thermoanaerobaculia bacterium]HUM29031.1 SPFH domain-containing protein [Thermoanaerobaculia bacterium]HXK67413.1 SPFH domain-containing protein [Thermoanaerobaculia bacterium]